MPLEPLPAATWALLLVLLTASVWHDLMHRRIPNRLLLCTACMGVVLAIIPSGTGLVSALVAALLAGAAMGPMYLLGWMGGGDLKLMTTAGLLVGMPRVTALCLSVAMAGGLLALWWQWRTRQQPQPRPAPYDRMPYALAIAMGTVAHGWLN